MFYRNYFIRIHTLSDTRGGIAQKSPYLYLTSHSIMIMNPQQKNFFSCWAYCTAREIRHMFKFENVCIAYTRHLGIGWVLFDVYFRYMQFYSPLCSPLTDMGTAFYNMNAIGSSYCEGKRVFDLKKKITYSECEGRYFHKYHFIRPYVVHDLLPVYLVRSLVSNAACL